MYNNLPALTDSILWDEKLLSTDYEALSEGTLAAALQSYLQAVRALKGRMARSLGFASQAVDRPPRSADALSSGIALSRTDRSG